MDSNGKSDPFCKISSNFSNQQYQTHTIKKTLSPEWNESFPIYVGEMEESHSISVKLYDRDLGTFPILFFPFSPISPLFLSFFLCLLLSLIPVGNDFLGESNISLKKLIDHTGDSLTSWYYLEVRSFSSFVALFLLTLSE